MLQNTVSESQGQSPSSPAPPFPPFQSRSVLKGSSAACPALLVFPEGRILGSSLAMQHPLKKGTRHLGWFFFSFLKKHQKVNFLQNKEEGGEGKEEQSILGLERTRKFHWAVPGLSWQSTATRHGQDSAALSGISKFLTCLRKKRQDLSFLNQFET